MEKKGYCRKISHLQFSLLKYRINCSEGKEKKGSNKKNYIFYIIYYVKIII